MTPFFRLILDLVPINVKSSANVALEARVLALERTLLLTLKRGRVATYDVVEGHSPNPLEITHHDLAPGACWPYWDPSHGAEAQAGSGRARKPRSDGQSVGLSHGPARPERGLDTGDSPAGDKG